MKHLLLLTALLFTACGPNRRDPVIPSAVHAAFAQRFPHAQSVQWTTHEGGIVEATFVQNGRPHSANFTIGGAWMETEQAIGEKELPGPVRAIIGARHPGATITLAERVSTPASELFEVELATDSGKVEVMLTPEGVVVPHDAADRE
ncbi:MAG: hypothetical protein QM724_00980 [Flavobacteriales bacterium]